MSILRGVNSRAAGAVSVLVVLLLLVGAGGFAGVSVLEARRLEIEAQQAQFDVLRRRLTMPAQSGPTEASISIDPFLAEDSFPLAANALQERVVNLIDEFDGKLISVGVDPQATGDEDAARRVSVHVAAELTNAALQKLLYKLETEPPFVFIGRLATSRAVVRGQEGKAGAQEPRLAVSMSLTGYRRKGQP